MSGRPGKDFSKKRKQLRAETAARLEAIVEAAERAAASVIDDAEGQARQYLAQARVEADRIAEGRFGELSDQFEALIDQAASLRREAERLQTALEEAQARIAQEPAAALQPREPEQLREDERSAQPQVPRLRAVAESEQPAPDADRADAAGARLLATQMAVSGSSREEIDARLRNGFKIVDTSGILDAILGPED